jgi:hypothetical protein
MFYKVCYRSWANETKVIDRLEVKQTQVWGERVYYAVDHNLLGCGVDEATPKLAIEALIADHGQFIYAVPL